jgi:hypothetical protein
MPDRVHILIRRHKHQAEDTPDNLQESSRLWVCDADLRPTDHPVWGGPGWKVFLDAPTDIERTIHYIGENPAKWRLSRQGWPFVKAYNGWPLHPGHSSNSPYAKRLRDHQE